MKFMTPAIVATVAGLAGAPAFAFGQSPSSATSTDSATNSQMSQQDCIAAQEAKHDGSTQQQMRDACSWTTDSGSSSSSTSSGATSDSTGNTTGGSTPPASTAPGAVDQSGGTTPPTSSEVPPPR